MRNVVQNCEKFRNSQVSDFHKQNRGMFPDEAMMEYLKVAEGLEMFGVSYFEVIEKDTKKVSLGIDALGINVYDLNNKLTPKLSFPWSQIRRVTKKKKQFIVSGALNDFIF